MKNSSDATQTKLTSASMKWRRPRAVSAPPSNDSLKSGSAALWLESLPRSSEEDWNSLLKRLGMEQSWNALLKEIRDSEELRETR
jgi:hypothetical protein